MSIGSRIRQCRKDHGQTLEDIAKYVKISRQTLSRYENGIICNIPSDKIEALALALHTTPAYLMGWEDDPQEPNNILPIETKRVPLLGEIACGEPIFADEQFECYVECGSDVKADFALRCKGDSMINARILDGDIVFVRKQERVVNGEIAAVIVDDEATLKRVYNNGDYVSLVAENPAYPPIIIAQDDNKALRILGKAIAFQSDVK